MQSIIFSLCLFSMVIGVSRAESLDVRPGLWETTTATEKKRAKQPINLNQLTPGQRAKVEAKLKKRIKKETHTFTACLSKARIESGEAFTGNTHRGVCDREFETQTAYDLVATVECRGVNKMTGMVKMHATDPEHMSGIVEMTYGPADYMQLFTHSEIHSRWLKSDCGEPAGAEVSGDAVR